MALYGPWGMFLHIQKCGGLAIRAYLRNKYGFEGKEIGPQHGYLVDTDGIENPWTVVRHPANWMLSYFTYCEANNWFWGESVPMIAERFQPVAGTFWPQFVKLVCQQEPGIVGEIFDLYAIPGVTVYQLEHINEAMGDEVPVIHSQEIKPVMTDEHWEMICEAEAETLERYGYSNQR